MIDNRIILVGPTHIIMALVDQVQQSDFWITCGASFLRIAIGFILSFIGGFVLVLVCYKYKIIRDFLEPIIYTNTLQGLESVDIQLLEMAQVFHLAPWKKFMFIYRPAWERPRFCGSS